jgi:polyisoprenoid-binding protein YceI
VLETLRALRTTVLVTALLSSALPALAQTQVFEIDAVQSTVRFTLGSTFHTVHGTFHLKPGSVQINPQTGVASGQIVVDANSGQSGNGSRDHRMKKDILETEKYPEITFTAQTIKGSVLPQGSSEVQLGGIFMLHGEQHPMTLNVEVTPATDVTSATSAETRFVVPYVKWGLKNPSELFLRVSDRVDIDVHAVGRLSAAP